MDKARKVTPYRLDPRQAECEMTFAFSLDRKQFSYAASFLLVLLALTPFHLSAAEPKHRSKLLVLDLELVGDLGDASLANTHEERIRVVSNLLRQELSALPAYEIVDATPANERIRSI